LEKPVNQQKTGTNSDIRWASGERLPKLVTVGDPILRQVAKENKNLEKLKPLCAELVTLLREFNGAGLAAPQIGLPDPVVVIEVRKTDIFPSRPESPLYVMINPKIEERSSETSSEWEGCFSIPGLMAKVERPNSIKVSYQNPDGERFVERFDGYLGRVIQHETDHLNGVLFTDLMDPLSLTTVENWKALYLPDIQADAR